MNKTYKDYTRMNFKKTALNLTLLAAIATSGMANAGSQFTVKVDGMIVPASCDIGNGSGSTTVQLGKLSADKLNTDSETMLPVKKMQLRIDCPSATAVAIQPTDVAEKAGQVSYLGMKMVDIFSLGATSDGAVIGGYIVKLDTNSTNVDQLGVSSFLSAPVGSNVWSTFDNSAHIVSGTGQNMYSWTRGSKGNAPAMGKVHTIGLEFTPFISPASTLKTSENIDIKGEATYDLVYL
ncbi:DUF1120 domain-containing protein [Pantoea agglomerans]|uniref:DUF1120 domain-containing protein n=1 Tax=Enterobacter agglomerans TaxID=549 RepID=A0ACC5RKQ5_ENTAG|nr:DUF1120 domain-containing protein [Pantoea agglomerans]MBK4725195.1 DUF1120 domain-containing protein [Pantoea agglomerans]